MPIIKRNPRVHSGSINRHTLLDRLLHQYALDNPGSSWPDPDTLADLHVALDEYAFQGWLDNGYAGDDDGSHITIWDLLGFSYETAQVPEQQAGISLMLPLY